MQETQRALNRGEYIIGVALSEIANPEDFLVDFNSEIKLSFRYVRELHWARLTEPQRGFFEQTGRVSVILRGVWTTVTPEINASIGCDKRNEKRRNQALLSVEKITVKPVSRITQSDFEGSGYSEEEFEDLVKKPKNDKFNPLSPVTIIELAEVDH